MRYLQIQVTNLSMHTGLDPGDEVSLRLETGNVDLTVVSKDLGMEIIELEIPDSVGELSIPQATLIRSRFATWATSQAYYVPEKTMARPIIPIFGSPQEPRSPFDIDWGTLQEMITGILQNRNPEDPDETSISIGDLILERVLRPIGDQFVGGFNPMQALPQMKSAWKSAVTLLEQQGMMPPFIWEPVKEKLLPVGNMILEKMCEEMPVVQRPPKKFDRKPLWDLSD